MNWSRIDKQMVAYSPFLRDQLKVAPPQSNRLASEIAREIEAIPRHILEEIKANDPVGCQARLDELLGFEKFMDLVDRNESIPALTRAQVITQNYICIVYLGESCFNVLKKNAPTGSVTKKCCKFLTDNPVRAFRNAIAHSNWSYGNDFLSLVYWARKGSDKDEPLSQFEVKLDDLNFWQALARTVGYVAFTMINEIETGQGGAGQRR